MFMVFLFDYYQSRSYLPVSFRLFKFLSSVAKRKVKTGKSAEARKPDCRPGPEAPLLVPMAKAAPVTNGGDVEQDGDTDEAVGAATRRASARGPARPRRSGGLSRRLHN